MAEGRLVLIGVPVGVFPTEPEGRSSALLRQGETFVDFDAEADELLRFVAVARRPEAVLEWLQQRSDEPGQEQVQQLVDTGVLWHFGAHRERDLAALQRIRLLPRGDARGPLAGSRDLHLIACGDGRNAAVDPFLYWTWVYSDGRSLAGATERVAEHFDVTATAVRDQVVDRLHHLLVPGAARVDLAP